MTMDRRSALKSVGALFGAMAMAGAAAPTKQPTPAPKAGADDDASRRIQEEVDEWGEQIYGKPGSVKRRRLDEAQAALLSAYGEVGAAMNAVLDADIDVDEDSCWLKDVDGIRYFVEWFISVLVSDAHGEVKDAADAELARRVEAHERGVYHHCPVYWGWSAIGRARETVRAILDRDYGPGEKPCIIELDVQYQAWCMEFWEGAYENEDHLHMNDAAKTAYMDALLARIAGDGNAAAAG